jgi:ABC-type multidrug transport system fused ATPase/permease subunit
MYFNFWDSSKILYILLLLFVLFLIIYIVIYFLIKWFKIYKSNFVQKNIKQEILENILKSKDIDKINLMLKHLNISSTYEISQKLNLDNKEVEYILSTWKIGLLSDLLFKKIKWN